MWGMERLDTSKMSFRCLISRTGKMVLFTELGRLEEKQVWEEKSFPVINRSNRVILFVILVYYQASNGIFKSGAQRKGHVIGHIYLRGL